MEYDVSYCYSHFFPCEEYECTFYINCLNNDVFPWFYESNTKELNEVNKLHYIRVIWGEFIE